jgi:hypothetical protein
MRKTGGAVRRPGHCLPEHLVPFFTTRPHKLHVCVLRQRALERERSCGGARKRERERDYSKVTAILLGMPATSLAATLRTAARKWIFPMPEFHLCCGACVRSVDHTRRNCATRRLTHGISITSHRLLRNESLNNLEHVFEAFFPCCCCWAYNEEICICSAAPGIAL